MRLARLMNLERAQLLVESASRPALQAFLTEWNELLHDLKAPRDLRWHLDVDPLEYWKSQPWRDATRRPPSTNQP